MSTVLYNFESKTIAKYLCVVDQEIFSVITWYDIASKLSNSYKNEAFEFIKPKLRLYYEKEIEENKIFDENPIDLMTKRSNLIRNWVAIEICSVQNIKTRKYLIHKFIEIAKYCREFNNFHSALSIVSGLLSSPVQRLKKTWELINNKEMAILNNLENLLSPISNMKYYRKAIAVAKGPIVPFFPIIMKDFRFIIDGNPIFKTLSSGAELVNFERYKIMDKVLNDIKKYSSEKYSFSSSFLPIIQRLPELMKKNNRTFLTKDDISYLQRYSLGSSSNSNSFVCSQQTGQLLSPLQTPSLLSSSDTPTLFSPDIQSPTFSYTNKSQSFLSSQSQGLFPLTPNPYHSFQNITNNAFNLFHGHNSTSFPTNEIEDIAIYIESRLYGKGLCSLSPSSLSSITLNNSSTNLSTIMNSASSSNKVTTTTTTTTTTTITITTTNNSNNNNISNNNNNNNNNSNNNSNNSNSNSNSNNSNISSSNSNNNINSLNNNNNNNNVNRNNINNNTSSNMSNLNDIIDINNKLYLDDNILTHILFSEFEIQNQKIAYNLSLACEPANSVSTTTSVSTFTSKSPIVCNEGSMTPSSIKISYQKYINDTKATKFNLNKLNRDSMETSLAEKSLSIILNTNLKLKNFDYKTNEHLTEEQNKETNSNKNYFK